MRLTLAGRIVVLIFLVILLAGPLGLLFLSIDLLSSGWWPILFFALPVLVAAGLLFGLTCFVLKQFGIDVFAPPSESDWEEGSFAPRAADARSTQEAEECPWCGAQVVAIDDVCPACDRPM